MPLLKDGGLNLSLDPQSVLRIFGHSYRRRVLSHCFGVGLNPTPMDVGLSPMLVFPTVLGVGLNPTPCHHRIQRKIYGVPKWPIDLGFL